MFQALHTTSTPVTVSSDHTTHHRTDLMSVISTQSHTVLFSVSRRNNSRQLQTHTFLVRPENSKHESQHNKVGADPNMEDERGRVFGSAEGYELAVNLGAGRNFWVETSEKRRK